MEQQHHIKKQLIEVRVGNNRDINALQEEISKIFHDSVVPYIDACCNTLSHPGITHKIDLLELDIGTINPHYLPTEFEEKLKPVLYKQLSEKIKTIPHSFSVEQSEMSEKSNASEKQTRSGLEVLTYFIQTGTLPWWVGKHDKHSLGKTLKECISNTPEELKSLFLANRNNSTAFKRFILQFPDADLLKIAILIAPEHAAFLQNYREDLWQLAETEVFKNIPEARLRLQQWQSLFLSILGNGFTVSQQESLVAQHLLHLASGLKIEYHTIIESIAKYITYKQKKPHFFKSPLPQIIAGIRTRLHADLVSGKNLSKEKQEKTYASVRKQHQELVKQISQLEMQLQALYWQGEVISTKASEGKQKKTIGFGQTQHQQLARQLKQLKTKLHALSLQEKTSGRSSPEEKQGETVGFAQAQYPKLAGQIMQLEEQLRELYQKEFGKNIQQQTEHLWQKMQQSSVTENSLETTDTAIRLQEEDSLEVLNKTFNQSEEFYINNAGLVLLWPFLPRFFETIGLVKEKAFADETDMETPAGIPGSFRERATLLLQYLTDGATTISEHLLPLNKVLCGIDVLQPLCSDIKLTDQEKEESENLLTAVTANNPLWKNLSVEGLQNAYLQREGVLSVRDGGWWLQVEKKTYDITMHQLPWSISVIKLPWMENILYTEW